MKNIQLLIAIILSLNFTSIASTNKGGDITDKDRMQIDAYAKANIECEYKLAKLEYSQNSSRKLKAKIRNLKVDVNTFRQKMFIRYSDEGGLKDKFNDLVKSSSAKLSICKKLESLEKSIAEENSEKLKAVDKESKDKK